MYVQASNRILQLRDYGARTAMATKIQPICIVSRIERSQNVNGVLLDNTEVVTYQSIKVIKTSVNAMKTRARI